MERQCGVDALDEMERGKSYEMLPDEVYLPVHDSRGWIKCNVIVNDDLYSLYMEKNYRLLLKAKKLDDVFYISTCEDFDAEIEIPNQRVSAKLM